MLRIVKNTSFYRIFERNRSIETIDGYDGMVYRGPFRLGRGRPILMNDLDDPA